MEKLVSMIAEMGIPSAYDHFAEGESPEPPFLQSLIHITEPTRRTRIS